MDLEPRITAPVHAIGEVELVPLDAISGDATFRLREEGDVSALAASIGRLGQLAPVELRPLPGASSDGPQWQVVAGFRRLRALRTLLREAVLARVHPSLPDEDAWALALVQSLLIEPLDAVEIESLREKLALTDHAPWADELLEEALARAPVSAEQRERFHQPLEGGDGEAVMEENTGDGDAVEVTPEELAADLAARLWAVNQDLALAFEAWKDLPAEGRRLVVEQARYVAELYPLIAGEDEG